MKASDISADHIKMVMYYLGPGNGCERCYEHLPSGIKVSGTQPPSMKAHQFDRELFAEFLEKLKEAGIITSTEP